MSVLHILNGAATLQLFRKSGLDGEVVVWNEILVEGPTIQDISSEEFRELRKSFTSRQFPDHDYDDMVWGIWQVLNSQQEFSEIVCWYEYDLFCQINFMAMIDWLNRNKPKHNVSIVCSGFDDEGELKGLGEWSPDYYATLYGQRMPLDASQRSMASDIWKLYCSGQHDKLIKIAEGSTLPYLKDALSSHIRRFPWTTDLLNEHQRMILSWVNEGIDSERQLVGKCLRNNGYYGFGDLQYFNMLDTLRDYINWKSQNSYQRERAS